MDFTLSTKLKTFKNTVRRIVEVECIPMEEHFLSNWKNTSRNVELDITSEIDKFSTKLISHLKTVSQDAGIFHLHLPKKYGGGGMGTLGAVVINEEIHRSLVHLPLAQCANILIKHATTRQEQQYTVPTIKGQKSAALYQAAAGADFHLNNPTKLTAVRYEDNWIINGVIPYMANINSADYIIIQAISDKTKHKETGLTLFILDTNSQGLKIDPIETWLTTPQNPQYCVSLNNVRVPIWKTLGKEGNGFYLGQHLLSEHENLMSGAISLGIMERGLAMATKRSLNRVTFGRPIAERQAIQWMLVDIFVNIKALRSITHSAAWKNDNGHDINIESSMIKYCAAEWGWRSIDKIMQIFGGLGERIDTPIPHWYHQLRHSRISNGTSEMHQTILARSLLSKTLEWEEN